MNPFLLYSIAFLAGGNAYCMIELAYRARTHYSMFFCSGIAIIIMLYIYTNNKRINPLLFAIFGTIIITTLEFIFGAVFNIMLNMNVWDYSNTPLNVLGQICVPFSLIWFGFSLIIYYIFKLLSHHFANIV